MMTRSVAERCGVGTEHKFWRIVNGVNYTPDRSRVDMGECEIKSKDVNEMPRTNNVISLTSSFDVHSRTSTPDGLALIT